MRYPRKRDPSAKFYGMIEVPDPEYTCAICGNGVYWSDEEVIRDKDGEICHASCAEKEE